MNTSEDRKNKVKIEELFDKLRTKLSSFEVININGEQLGRIKDFTLDKNRRLYMVVPQLNNQTDSPVLLLSSKYIHHVDSSNRTVFIDISHEDLKKLPLYQHSNQTFSEPSLSASNQQETDSVRAKNQQQDMLKSPIASDLEEGQIIHLLEERLIINRSRQKIGVVIVRKQIKTRFIEVPVKRETLIIDKIDSAIQQPIEFEQLSPENFSDQSKTASVSNSTLGEPENTNLQEQVLDSDSPSQLDTASQIVEEEIVRLLEERLVINRRKWKVGEVVVRKGIETETIQVPIRREVLIVEQIGLENKILAEIDLANAEVTEVSPGFPQVMPDHNTVVGEFLSPKSASNLLEAIALQKHHGCAKVRIELVVEDSDLQDTYQKMFDRCSIKR